MESPVRCYAKPYEGKEPFAFFSYCHRDESEVFPIIERLILEGCRVWYDDGLHPGQNWPQEVAEHLDACAVCFVALSAEYAISTNCINEMNFAISDRKPIVPIMMEPFQMTLAMRLQLSSFNYIKRTDYPSMEAFLSGLFRANGIGVCHANVPAPNAEKLQQWRNHCREYAGGGAKTAPAPSPVADLVYEEAKQNLAAVEILLNGAERQLEAAENSRSAEDKQSLLKLLEDCTKRLSGKPHPKLTEESAKLCARLDELRKRAESIPDPIPQPDPMLQKQQEMLKQVTGSLSHEAAKFNELSFSREDFKKLEVMLQQLNACEKQLAWEPLPELAATHSALVGAIARLKDSIEDALNKIALSYTVRWLDEQGTVLEIQRNLPEGTVPQYTGNVPEKAGNDYCSYTFSGWSPAPTALKDDTDYVACFTAKPRIYTVTWKDEDGSILKQERYVAGLMPKVFAPQKGIPGASVRFIGWEPEITEVRGDAVYTARFKIGPGPRPEPDPTPEEDPENDVTRLDGKPFAVIRLSTGQIYISSRLNITLGRKSANKIAIPDVGSISGFHAEITQNYGRFYLSDVGSSFGTFVSETKLEQRQQVELQEELVSFMLTEENFIFCRGTVMNRIRKAHCVAALRSIDTGETRVIADDQLPLDRYHKWNNPVLWDGSVRRENNAAILYHDGCYWLKDIASANGTFLGGSRLENGEERRLHHGDRVGIVNYEFEFLQYDLKEEVIIQ